MNDTDNQQERLMDLTWLAGIWEGEGNISLVMGSGNRIMPRASVVNTDFVLIEEIASALKRLNIGFYIQSRKGGGTNNPKHSDCKVITIAGVKRVNNFAKTLGPHMRGAKRNIAEKVVEYTEYRLGLPRNAQYTSKDLETVQTVRALNKKGPSESSETIRYPLDWVFKTRDGNSREELVPSKI